MPQLLDGRDPRGMRTDVAARLAGHRARARPRAGRPPGHPLGRPWRPGVAAVARRPRARSSRCRTWAARRSGCGSADRCASTRCRRRWPSWAPGRRRPTAPTSRPSSAPGWPEPAPPWSPARRSASTRPPTGEPWPATGPRSRSWPAASTAPTRPRTSSCSTTSAEHCAVVSEVAPGCAPMRVRFLSRNRVIAALSRGTVVVEAAVRERRPQHRQLDSRLNRPLMGVPGPVTSAPSEGVHQLIRSGAATLVTRADDVLELTGLMGEHLVGVRPRAHDRPRPADPAPAAGPRGGAVGALRTGRLRSPARPGSGSRRSTRCSTGWPACGLVERMPTGWRLADAADEG